MAKPHVFVSRPLPEASLVPLRPLTDVSVWPEDLPTPREALLNEAAASDALITVVTERIDRELLDASPKLRVVANVAVGYDNIDVPEASRRGVLVTNTPDVLTETTADLAFALLMSAARQVAYGDRYLRAGAWRNWGFNLFLGRDVHEATLGIIGLGRIGLAVARRARGFGMRCVYYSRTRKLSTERRYRVEYLPLDDLLREADFVSLHVPLSGETQRLIGERELSLMKPTAILVNTARGSIVDADALYRALKEGRIAGAALDVTDPEPLPMDSPLLELDNLVVTPHIGSASSATRRRMADMAVANVLATLQGRTPPNCVNQEALPLWRKRNRISTGDQ